MKPTEKTISGRKSESFPAKFACDAIRPAPLLSESTNPMIATIWRRRTSAFPKLQVPGIYDVDI
jgi:hypothetical protein